MNCTAARNGGLYDAQDGITETRETLKQGIQHKDGFIYLLNKVVNSEKSLPRL